MLELLAIAPEDGWAFVRSGERIRLVRPPYAHCTPVFVDGQTVEKAILTHGFAAQDRKFDDWQGLVAFLNEQVVASRAAQGKPIPEPGAVGKAALQFAPPDVLAHFLDRIEKELLPARRWHHAQDLLLDMIRLPAVSQDPHLRERAAALLKGTIRAVEDPHTLRSRDLEGDPEFEDNFANAIQVYTRDGLMKFTKDIAERGQILSPAEA